MKPSSRDEVLVDLGLIRTALMRVIVMSDGGFAAAAAERRLRQFGTLLPLLLIIPGAAATVMYEWVLVGSEGMDRTRTAMLVVVKGTPVAFGLWLLWAFMIEGALRIQWRVPVSRERLLGAMGFASWPLAILWWYWLPDWLQGARRTLGHTGVWIVAAVGVLWLVYTVKAVREVVPDAEERQVLLATTGGFVVAMGLLMAIANRWATAPWVSVFTRASDLFIG